MHDAVHDRMLWALTDRQGSVRGLWGRETDTSTPGLLVYREYGPFGDLTDKNLLPAGEQIFVSAAYTGRDYDPTVELYNYRSRHYDPQLGTFTQEDGIGIAADLNRYRYVGNSPTNATDPSGHFSVITGLIGAGIGAVGGAINAYINDEDILVGAGKGALIGGIAGLTAGLASTAVTAYLGGTAASSAVVGTGTAYFAGNTVGAAVGDLASQGLSIAMGDQKSFSWQQLAGATATGALLGPLSVGAGRMFAASTFAKGALRPLFMAGGSAASGAAGNAISQGINIASGVQESWDWNQFKIAAAMGGLGGLAGNYAGLFDKTCFRAGTPLVCEGGHKKVEDLQVGDRLAARDEFDPDGPIEFKAIEEVFVRRGLILEVTVAGQTIGTTAEHPFYVFQRGWTPAGELKVGDLLATADGRYLPVEKLHQTGNLETVYNFRVADHHTYFVADQHWGFEVWVHNSYFGGRHRETKKGGKLAGTESHHLIADDSSDIATNDALAIRIDKPQHVETGSWGTRRSAVRFREKQQALVQAGDYDSALQMGIDDIRERFPDQYEVHIADAIASAPRTPSGSIDWSAFKKKM
ncbi:MAG: hypothetical protein J0M17_22385 [Planctomycetes bacterium]|nr:hypothetical protein [Planctomycetota bacterium]